MSRIAGIFHRELRHRIDAVIKEHQRRERLVDRHAENLTKTGEAGGRDPFKEMRIVQLIGIPYATQYAIVHQNRCRFAVALGKGLPVTLRGLFKIGFTH